SVDGAYGCNTAGHTTCTIPVSEGTHALKAVRSDNGSSTSLTATVPAAGYRWTLFNVTGGGATNARAARARACEAKVDNFNRRCTGARSISQAALYQSCASEKAALAAEQNRICSECPGCQRSPRPPVPTIRFDSAQQQQRASRSTACPYPFST